MESMEYPECTEAVKRLIPIMGDSFSKISDLIGEIPVLSEVQKKFYCCVMECRYDKVFLPLYQKIISRKKTGEAGEVQ